MVFNKLFWFLGQNLAMDLGTANTLIYTPREGIVLNEPSVVALDSREEHIIAVGSEAKSYLGKTPDKIKAIRPLKNGVIADFEVTQTMISTLIDKAIRRKGLIKPKMVICVPTGITQVEKKAVVESAQQAGAREISLIEEPVAAAIGAGLPISEPLGNMVVDIGGGTTEVAVISLSAVAYAESVRVAGDEMDEAIQRFLRNEHRLLIGSTTAERLKCSLSASEGLDSSNRLKIRGKSQVDGVPRVIELEKSAIWESMREPVNAIIGAVLRALEKIPPELTTDVANNGMLLAGGGAKLAGLPRLLSQESGIPVAVDEEPLTTVLRGTGILMQNERHYRDIFIT